MACSRFSLPAGVHFEVPHQYAGHCGGRPVRVVPLAEPELDVIVTWDAEVLSVAYGASRVEYDTLAIKGLLVDPRRNVIADVVWCTLDVLFVGKQGETGGLPLFTAHLVNESAFQDVVAAMRACSLPIPMVSSIRDLSLRPE